MKLLIAMGLVGFTGLAQAYTFGFELDEGKYGFNFAENETIVTWGVNSSLGNGDGVPISYSFAESDFLCGGDCSPIQSIDYQVAISGAFDEWASVANLSFNQVEDRAGEIVVAFKTLYPSQVGEGGMDAIIHTRSGLGYSYASGGTVFLDIAEDWSDSSFLDSIALHEVGHALGLGHTDPATVTSIMNPVYSSAITSLQLDDINGIQALYGVSAIPEPSSYLLMLGGLGLVGFMATRRRKLS
ncbi:MAG: matrixin family metalloprotease [Thiomicrorhabdus sp.]|nr:matrixin family metalloprotease [Thiomicrorhabdus sp.]